jgi:hypothetical protein
VRAPRTAAKSEAGRASRQIVSQAEQARLRASTRSRLGHQRKIGWCRAVIRRLGICQVIGDGGGCQELVRKAGENRHLFAARRGAPGWHHRRGVPVQHGGGFVQRGDAVKNFGEALIWGHGSCSLFRAKKMNSNTKTMAKPNQVRAYW